MMRLFNFGEFVNEAMSPEERQELMDFGELASVGVVEPKAYDKLRRKAYYRSGLRVNDVLNDPEMAQMIAPNLYRAMQSPEFQALVNDGWTVSSTDKQMFLGTLAITTPVANRRGPNGWPTSIAVSKNRYIRRIWSGSLPQVLVNNLSGDETTGDLYVNAFKWIRSNIDPNHPGLRILSKRARTDSGTGISRYRGFTE